MREIQKKSVLQAGSSDLGTNDGKVNFVQCLHRFQIDDHSGLHEKIEAVDSHCNAIIFGFNGFLLLDQQAALAKFDYEGIFVNGFQKPRT